MGICNPLICFFIHTRLIIKSSKETCTAGTFQESKVKRLISKTWKQDGKVRQKNETENEVTIERSRFISYTKKCETEEEARAFLEEKRKAHPFATHNCYAYVTERGKIARFSDDGEPQGTAGQPILEVIKNKKLLDTIVVVTRYFGGIKLGAGGLVRAYSSGAKEVLEKAGETENILSAVYSVNMSYDLYTQFLKFISKIKCSVISTDFADTVDVKIAVPNENDDFVAKITDLTNSKAAAEKIGEEFVIY